MSSVAEHVQAIMEQTGSSWASSYIVRRRMVDFDDISLYEAMDRLNRAIGAGEVVVTEEYMLALPPDEGGVLVPA